MAMRAPFPAGFAIAFALLRPCAAQDVVTLPAPPPGAAQASPSYSASESVRAGAPAVASAARRTSGLLWKATSGAHTVYLVGSIHFASADMYPLPEAMESAFQASSVLVVELDPRDANAMKALNLVASRGMYPPGDSLWNHVSARTREGLSRLAGGGAMSAEMLARMKPWAVDLIVVQQLLASAGVRSELGIDMHFLEQARSGKRVDQLETPEEQVQAMLDTPESEQIRSLEETLADPDGSRQDLEKMKTAWLSGDTAAIDALMASDFKDAPVTRKKLLEDRNVRMAAAVERYLKGGETCFVVVGAAHMVGKDGIVSRLAEKGFVVKQVLSAN
jgi:uncharacterized protein